MWLSSLPCLWLQNLKPNPTSSMWPLYVHNEPTIVGFSCFFFFFFHIAAYDSSLSPAHWLRSPTFRKPGWNRNGMVMPTEACTFNPTPGRPCYSASNRMFLILVTTTKANGHHLFECVNCIVKSPDIECLRELINTKVRASRCYLKFIW